MNNSSTAVNMIKYLQSITCVSNYSKLAKYYIEFIIMIQEVQFLLIHAQIMPKIFYKSWRNC